TTCTYRTPDVDDTPLPITVRDRGFSATVPDSAIVTCSMTNRAPARPSVDIEKATNGADADNPPGPFIAIGGPAPWSYVVTNTRNTTLSQVAVTDNQGVAITCPGTSIAPGQQLTCTASGVALGLSYANVGTVNAVDSYGTAVTDSDPSHYTGAVAGIDVEKA